MKRFFPLLSLSFATAFLFSCETEEVEPSLNAASVNEASAPYCQDYSYFNKLAEGPMVLGKASDDLISVGFAEGLSLQAKHRILDRYPLFQSIAGELASETGTITLVNLQTGGSCTETEKLLDKLLREPQIKFAYPFFENNDPNAEQMGLSNEFIVFLEETGTVEQLEKLVTATNTNLAISYDDKFHLITVNKNSNGHLLQIISKFNQQSFVTVAEPNLIFGLPAVSSESESFVTAKTLKRGSYKMLEE